MAPLRADAFLLDDAAVAAGRVAAAGPYLKAGEIRLAAVPARVPLTRMRISTPDRTAARSLAAVLRLDDNRWSQHDVSDWSGHLTFPSTAQWDRPMRVDLVVMGEPLEPTITLQEASDLLDLLAGAVLLDIPVPLIHLRARDDDEDDQAEIHTTDPRYAQILQAELARVDLPLRTVVLAPTP